MSDRELTPDELRVEISEQLRLYFGKNGRRRYMHVVSAYSTSEHALNLARQHGGMKKVGALALEAMAGMYLSGEVTANSDGSVRLAR